VGGMAGAGQVGVVVVDPGCCEEEGEQEEAVEDGRGEWMDDGKSDGTAVKGEMGGLCDGG